MIYWEVAGNFGFWIFKKKARVSDRLDSEIDNLFVSNLRAIINKDRARHGQPLSNEIYMSCNFHFVVKVPGRSQRIKFDFLSR